MTDFNDIKNLWQNQKVMNVPAYENLLREIKNDRRKIITKNILGSLSLVLTLVIVLAVLFGYDFEYLTTRLGIILMVIAITGGLIMNTLLLKIISGRLDDSSDCSQYLKELIRYRNTQRVIQTKGISIYFIVLTAGLILYLFEFFLQDNNIGIISYVLTLGWIAFVWFYLRPRTIKKQEKRISELIRQAENISEQLKEV